MLSKDLTPHPKAVNIIRPLGQQQQQQQQQQPYSPPTTLRRQPNFSSSTNSSSRTFSTASTTTTTLNTHYTNMNAAPMIRQPSSENPGLSFFCQSPHTGQPKAIQKPFENMHQKQAQHQPPLVISRINLSNFNRRPTVQTDLDHGMTTLDEDEDADMDVDDVLEEEEKEEEEEEKNQVKIVEPAPSNRLPKTSFAPGFGMISGVGSFLLRGNIASQPPKPQVDEARVYRKIEDLEIEKKSLLTLNQTLETVVKEQSNTISDLQNRLAAIERPLTPGLDTSSSKNGIMSSADLKESTDLEQLMEEEDAAFERIRYMLLDLIEQAQSAVILDKKTSGRVITGVEGQYRMKQNENLPQGRPRSVIGDRSTQNQQRVSRRTSLGSISNAPTSPIHINSNANSRRLSTSSHSSLTKIHSSPSTSPIPNRRYPMQRSVSRSSSPAALNTTTAIGNLKQHTGAKASKYSNTTATHKHKAATQHDSLPRKWLN